MALPPDNETFKRQWKAGSGPRALKPIKPLLPGQWRPGMPCHWMEQTSRSRFQSRIRRVLYLAQFAATAAYLQFRYRRTIGIFDRSQQIPYYVYQLCFFALECLCAFPLLLQMLQVWNVCRRNCVDFKQIPLRFLKPRSDPLPAAAPSQQPSAQTVYPTIAVYIPCYNEDVQLVRDTVVGALRIDYPTNLLSVYLCDDGKDPKKEAMIASLKARHHNVFYVTRPDNKHAKAGNLNHALENTHSDLVITLDADFIPRPNIVQRLLPYYYVWDPQSELYEFNQTLAVVQTPQHYRNLSPYDSDPLDQRSLLFFQVIQPGKDWLNASTMVGTNNLISRAALEDASYYPYYSITEDTAMSLRFHSLGYRTYYVNESVATGLATTTLRGNLRQRARWMKGDWQILFSRHGPFLVRGLTVVQRLLYLNMGLGRLMSFVFIIFDAASIALLLGGITPLDVQYPIVFIMYLAGFLLFSTLAQFSLTAGGKGLHKSAAGNVVFETIFRYTTVKGLFAFIFRGKNLVFKVTDKSPATATAKMPKKKAVPKGGEQSGPESEDDGGSLHSHSLDTPTDHGDTISEAFSDLHDLDVSSEHSAEVVVDVKENEQPDSKNGGGGKTHNERREHRRLRRSEVLHNLKRIWFNILAAVVLIFSIVWGLLHPRFVDTTIDGVTTTIENGDVFPMALAIGFIAASALPHLLAIFLCFRPYVVGWMLTDVVHGRCDQFAVHPKTGKLFVPWSYIILVTVGRTLLIFGAMVFVLVYTILNSDPIVIGLP